MHPPANQFEMLEQERALWLGLADAIERAQSALLRGDLVAFEQSTTEQARCCQQYHLQGAQPRSKAVPDGTSDGCDTLLRSLDEARRKVRHLNLVQAALLRRAHRSLRIVRHLLGGSEDPYSPPASLHQAPALCGED